MTSEVPLDELQWSSPEWIQMFGLSPYNVLEYFSQSPFFDRASNNQVLRMQYQFHPQRKDWPQTHPEFVKGLRGMTGVEFIVHSQLEPSYYIIRKQQRLGTNDVQIIQDYFIININVYQSPSIFNILNSRLFNCVTNFKTSFNILNEIDTSELELMRSIHELESKLNTITNKENNEMTNNNKNPTMNTPRNSGTPLSVNNQTVGTPGTITTSNNKHAAVFDKLLSITMKEWKSEKVENNETTG